MKERGQTTCSRYGNADRKGHKCIITSVTGFVSIKVSILKFCSFKSMQLNILTY